MNKIKIIIGRANDSTYGAYADIVEGIYCMGDTKDDAKKEALAGLDIMKNVAPNQLPNWVLAGDFEIEFKFDVESLLNYY